MLHPLIAILTNSGELQNLAVPLAVISNVVTQAAALIGEMVGVFSMVVLLGCCFTFPNGQVRRHVARGIKS